jgi:phosphatidylethanolamine-binding protein (PEBP) family uncharacterized protein
MGLNIKDLKIESTSFGNLERIPDGYVYDKGNTSPGLRWSGVPEGTKQLAVICHDPDAPLPHGFTHWVVYGIPADVTEIAEGDAEAFTQGTTGFGEPAYGGPMPPEGHGQPPLLLLGLRPRHRGRRRAGPHPRAAARQDRRPHHRAEPRHRDLQQLSPRGAGCRRRHPARAAGYRGGTAALSVSPPSATNEAPVT